MVKLYEEEIHGEGLVDGMKLERCSGVIRWSKRRAR